MEVESTIVPSAAVTPSGTNTHTGGSIGNIHAASTVAVLPAPAQLQQQPQQTSTPAPSLKASFSAVAAEAADRALKLPTKNPFKAWKKSEKEKFEPIPSPVSVRSLNNDDEGTLSIIVDSDIPGSPQNMTPTAFVVMFSSTAEDVIQLVLDKFEIPEKSKSLRLAIRPGNSDEISLVGLIGINNISPATQAGLRHLIKTNQITITPELMLMPDDLPLLVKQRLQSVSMDPVFVVKPAEDKVSASIDGKENLASDLAYANEGKPKKGGRVRSHTFAHGLPSFRLGRSDKGDTTPGPDAKFGDSIKSESSGNITVNTIRVVFGGTGSVGHLEDGKFKLSNSTTAKSVIQSVFKKFDVDLKASDYQLIFFNGGIDLPLKSTDTPLTLAAASKNPDVYFLIRKSGITRDVSKQSVTSSEEDRKQSEEPTFQIRVALDWNRSDQRMLNIAPTDTFKMILPKALSRFFLQDPALYYSFVFHWKGAEFPINQDDNVLAINNEHMYSPTYPVEPVFILRDDRIQVSLPIAAPPAPEVKSGKESVSKRLPRKSLSLKIPFVKSSSDKDRGDNVSNSSLSPRDSDRNLGGGHSPRHLPISETSTPSITPKSTSDEKGGMLTPKSPPPVVSTIQLIISTPDGDIVERKLRIKPDDTAKDIVTDVCKRHTIDDWQNYMLFLKHQGTDRALDALEHPYAVKESLADQNSDSYQFIIKKMATLRTPQPSQLVLAGPESYATEGEVRYGFIQLSIHSDDGEINEPRSRVANKETAKILIDRVLSRHDLDGKYTLLVQSNDLQRIVDIDELPLRLNEHLMETHSNVLFHLYPTGSVANMQLTGSVANMQFTGSVADMQLTGSVANVQTAGSVNNVQTTETVSNIESTFSTSARSLRASSSQTLQPPTILYNYDQVEKNETETEEIATGFIKIRFKNVPGVSSGEVKSVKADEVENCRSIIQRLLMEVDPKLKWQHYSMLILLHNQEQLLKYIHCPLLIKNKIATEKDAEPLYIITYSKGKTDSMTAFDMKSIEKASPTKGKEEKKHDSINKRIRSKTFSLKTFSSSVNEERKAPQTQEQKASPATSSGPLSENVDILVCYENGTTSELKDIDISVGDSALVVMKKVKKVVASDKNQTYSLYLKTEQREREMKISEYPLLILRSTENSKLMFKLEKKAAPPGKTSIFKLW